MEQINQWWGNGGAEGGRDQTVFGKDCLHYISYYLHAPTAGFRVVIVIFLCSGYDVAIQLILTWSKLPWINHFVNGRRSFLCSYFFFLCLNAWLFLLSVSTASRWHWQSCVIYNEGFYESFTDVHNLWRSVGVIDISWPQLVFLNTTPKRTFLLFGPKNVLRCFSRILQRNPANYKWEIFRSLSHSNKV